MTIYRVDVPIYVSVYVHADSPEDAQGKAISGLEDGIGGHHAEIELDGGGRMSPMCTVIDALEIDVENQDDSSEEETETDV